MKHALLFMVMFFTVVVYAKEAQESSKVYRSFGAEYEATLSIVPHNTANHYLINFEGFEHEVDGTSKLYEKIWNSRSRNDGYYYQLVGGVNQVNFRNNNKSTLIHGTVVPYFEVSLAEKSNTKMIFSGVSNRFDEREIRGKYVLHQGLVESKVEAKRRINTALGELESACRQALEVEIDWPAFQARGMKAAPAMLQRHLQALALLCGADTDYLEAINEITSISVKPAAEAAHAINLVGTVLSVRFSDLSPNVTEISRKLILEVL